jgi:hypothetical protein
MTGVVTRTATHRSGFGARGVLTSDPGELLLNEPGSYCQNVGLFICPSLLTTARLT